MHKFVTIENLSETDEFRAKFDGATYTIPPGGSRMVPYTAMCVWMGDPETVNKPTFKERDIVYRRICRYFHARGLMGNEPEKLPKLRALDEEGRQIITVMDDPEGTTLRVGDDAPADIGLLQKQIERLQAQLEGAIAGITDAPKRPTRTRGRGKGTDSTLEGGRGTAGRAGEKAAAKARQDAVERGEAEPEVAPDPDTPAMPPEDAPSKVPVGRS